MNRAEIIKAESGIAVKVDSGSTPSLNEVCDLGYCSLQNLPSIAAVHAMEIDPDNTVYSV